MTPNGKNKEKNPKRKDQQNNTKQSVVSFLFKLQWNWCIYLNPEKKTPTNQFRPNIK